MKSLAHQKKENEERKHKQGKKQATNVDCFCAFNSFFYIKKECLGTVAGQGFPGSIFGQSKGELHKNLLKIW